MDGNVAHTGIEGLDEILRGGLPRNRIYLVRGQPGTGKTMAIPLKQCRTLTEG